MLRRHDQDHLIAEERLERDPAVARRRADDAELQLAVGDLLDDPVRVRDGELDAQSRMLALELADEERHDGASGPRRGADGQLAAKCPLAAGAGHLAEQMALERYHSV